MRRPHSRLQSSSHTAPGAPPDSGGQTLPDETMRPPQRFHASRSVNGRSRNPYLDESERAHIAACFLFGREKES